METDDDARDRPQPRGADMGAGRNQRATVLTDLVKPACGIATIIHGRSFWRGDSHPTSRQAPGNG